MAPLSRFEAPERQEAWFTAQRRHTEARFAAADEDDAATMFRTLDHLLAFASRTDCPVVCSIPEAWAGVIDRFIVGRLPRVEDEFTETNRYKGAFVQASLRLRDGETDLMRFEDDQIVARSFVIPAALDEQSIDLFLTLRGDGCPEDEALSLAHLVGAV